MFNGFQQKQKELKKTIKNLEKDKRSLGKEKEEFANKFDLIMKNITEIKEQEKANDNKIAELSQKYEELRIQNMKQNSEITRLSIENVELKTEISRLSNENVDLKNEISRLSEENIILDLKIEALNIKCDNLFTIGHHKFSQLF